MVATLKTTNIKRTQKHNIGLTKEKQEVTYTSK